MHNLLNKVAFISYVFLSSSNLFTYYILITHFFTIHQAGTNNNKNITVFRWAVLRLSYSELFAQMFWCCPY